MGPTRRPRWRTTNEQQKNHQKDDWYSFACRLNIHLSNHW